MKVQNPTIQKLLDAYKPITLLGKAKAVLDWDLNVNMPPKGAAGRAEQTTYLADLITGKWHEPEFKSLIEKANTETKLTEEEKAIVRNLNYGAKYYYSVPKKVILDKEKVTSEAFVIWQQARENSEYKKFLPFLTKIIDLDQIIAEHLGYKDNPYDALLDMYEPELTASYVESTFSELKKELVVLVKKIQKSKGYVEESGIFGPGTRFPVHEQEKLSQWVTRRMGYDLQAGRIDIAPHPFTTTLDRYDIRVTTHYNDNDFRESFTSSVHEGGHALYEQGIDPKYNNTPLEFGVSFGIHETMSRFWENMVGKNPAFLRFVTPLFQSSYPKELGNATEDEIVKAFNIVKPSLIRIYADEVTYSLHIILRFEMENALINGKITPRDAAEAWREKAKKLFGAAPKTDSDGILQDVHWTYGAFGYFPAYALGNLYGAQILQVLKKDIKLDEELGKGNLVPIKLWLDKNVHQYGSLYFPKDLIKKISGKPLSYTHFVEYLTKKYASIYQF